MVEIKKNKSVDVVSDKPESESVNQPIIVSRKPIMSDPEFVAQASEDETMPKNEEDNVNRNNFIKFDSPKDKEEVASEAAKLETKPVTENNPESSKDKPEPEKPNPSEQQRLDPVQESSPASETNEPKPDSEGQSTPPEAQSDAAKVRLELQQEEVSRAHMEKINQLITQERYFLPINMKEKRYNHRVILIGVLICILLAAVWLDIALDAGIIRNSWHLPHTNFFVLNS